MSSLINWVNDELHVIFGYSDSSMGHYLVAMAKKSTDTGDFLQRLSVSGTVDIDEGMTRFAGQLMERVPHAGMMP